MRKLPVATLALAALLALSGCVPEQPPVTSTPVPSSTPVFASDEDALAAAEVAYAEYLRVSDEITADGGASPERIESLVTADQYRIELDGFTLYQSKGWRTSGASKFDTAKLQSYDDGAGHGASVSMYVCSDISNLRILDSSGADVTPGNVPLRQTLQITLVTEVNSNLLVLDGTEVWDSSSNC